MISGTAFLAMVAVFCLIVAAGILALTVTLFRDGASKGSDADLERAVDEPIEIDPQSYIDRPRQVSRVGRPLVTRSGEKIADVRFFEKDVSGSRWKP